MNLPRHRFARRQVWAGFVAGAALFAVGLGGLPSSAAPTPGPSVASAGSLGPPTAITLVSGDVLKVSPTKDGKVAVAFEASTSEPQAFTQYADQAGDLHVVPTRLLPLLADRLDPRLFNVSALLRDGYGVAADGTGRGLPLMITYSGGPVAVPGLTVERELPSISGAAGSLDPGGRLGEALLRTASSRGFLTGVDKIWLDGPMHASLDESVPQIGAPAVWEAGYDGSGVTIAVVDTGIDDTHEDLAGRVVAAEVFAEADSPIDVFGHGTHVASIAAGTGAASDGRYTGVAYGADLVNAKVLDDFGSGLESWVIAGMEWAAIDQDSDIVNMSINGGPTDGTDPVSQAVNNLSADEGALFVTSAGNFGGFPESIETPATADAALAVGGVDKSDVLSWYSAWGPRLDGTAVKPEIVAPGDFITAARAEGSEIGQPVGEDYMELSGTSMATPHVSGAAALLLDANPNWTWDQLKSALVTSAVDVGGTAFQQGGGRVDVAAALDQAVHADLATIDLGVLEYPHDDGETATVDVTLTNTGDSDLTLDLTTTAVNDDGEPAPAEMITVEPATLDLASGESAIVTTTFDPQTGPIGLFGGRLTASVAGVEALHVPLSFLKEPELVNLSIDVVARPEADGIFGVVNVQNVDDIDTFFEQYEVFETSTVETRVPPGNYSVSLISAEFVGFSGFNAVAVAEPEIAITGPTSITLDSNATTEVEVDVGEDAANLETAVSIYRASEVDPYGGVPMSTGGSGFDPMHAYASPTEPITLGAFEFFSKWTFEGEAAHYDLIFPEPDAVPETLSYAVDPDKVAHVWNSFHADVDRTYYDGRFYFRPYSFGSGIGLMPLAVPVLRHDIVTADDTVWAQTLEIGNDEGFASMDELYTTYTPREVREQSWAEGPTRPLTWPEYGPIRIDDTLAFYVPPWTDQNNHVGYEFFAFEGPGVDTFRLAVEVDGDPVGESTTPYGEFPLPPGRYAEVEVSLDAARDAPWWLHSVATSTTWRFLTEPPNGQPLTIPLMQVNYDVDLDLSNESDAPNPIGFQVYCPACTEVSAFRASWSIDDGSTWTPLELTDLGLGAYESVVPVPPSCDPSCFVSLQVAADDATGSSVEQEVLRAYTARYVAPTTPPVTPTETTTLPPTGAGNVGMLVGLAVAVLIVGGLAVIFARRRLTKQD